MPFMAEEKHLRDMRTVWWQEDASGEAVCMIDQSLLPGQIVNLTLTHEQQVAEAISTLKVRGAPAIGVTAAFAMALALTRDRKSTRLNSSHRCISYAVFCLKK